MDCPDDRTRITPEPAPVWQATVLPAGPSFVARADLPLLTAAEQAGLDWPSSCRNGTCRTCIQRLAKGSVRYAIEWPGLLAEEKAEGWILPCVAYATGDLELSNASASGTGAP